MHTSMELIVVEAIQFEKCLYLEIQDNKDLQTRIKSQTHKKAFRNIFFVGAIYCVNIE